jgi:hypothetical protein
MCYAGYAWCWLNPWARGKALPERPAFQPYWGKPAVRNDGEEGGNVGIMRSPLRASFSYPTEPHRPRVMRGQSRGWTRSVDSCVRPGRDDEIDRFRIVGKRDVFGRRLVRVQPIRMRVVDAEEFEPPLAEFPHQAHELLGRNFVIPDWISRDVLRRERLRD